MTSKATIYGGHICSRRLDRSRRKARLTAWLEENLIDARVCAFCAGSGHRFLVLKCKVCQGWGEQPTVYCPQCGGSGKGMLFDCELCAGRRRINGWERLNHYFGLRQLA